MNITRYYKKAICAFLTLAMLLSMAIGLPASAEPDNDKLSDSLVIQVDFNSLKDVAGNSAESVTLGAYSKGTYATCKDGAALSTKDDTGIDVSLDKNGTDCSDMDSWNAFTLYSRVRIGCTDTGNTGWSSLFKIGDSEFRTYIAGYNGAENLLNVRLKGSNDFTGSSGSTGITLPVGEEFILAESFVFDAEANTVVGYIYVSTDDGETFTKATSAAVSAESLFASTDNLKFKLYGETGNKITFEYSDFRIYSAELTEDDLKEITRREQAFASEVTISDAFVGQLRLIEPWGLQVSTYLSLNGTALTENEYCHSALKGFGYYFYVADSAEEADMLAHGEKIAANGFQTANGTLCFSGDLTGIYTQNLNKTICVMAYADFRNAPSKYSEVHTVCPLDMVTELKGNELLSAEERGVYAAMEQMYTAYAAYLASLNP